MAHKVAAHFYLDMAGNFLQQSKLVYNSFRRLRNESDEWRSSLTGAITQFSFGLAGAATGVATLNAMMQPGIRMSAEYELGLRKVWTMFDLGEGFVKKLGNQMLDLSSYFGESIAITEAAEYQALSSGIVDVSDSMMFMDAASRLAIGGVTDMKTAVDGLTSIMGAYSMEAEKMVEVTDAMFLAAKMGKTEIWELSQHLGRVVPMAAQFGVTPDEVMAAVSTMTTQGLSTAHAVTRLNAMMASIMKAERNKAAMEEAQRLGVDFSVASLQEKGLLKFFSDVINAQGFMTASWGRLMQATESMVGAQSLMVEGGKRYAKQLDRMSVKAGETQKAFEKVYNSLIYQGRVLTETLRAMAIKAFNPIRESLTLSLKLINPILIGINKIMSLPFMDLIGTVGILLTSATILAATLASLLVTLESIFKISSLIAASNFAKDLLFTRTIFTGISEIGKTFSQTAKMMFSGKIIESMGYFKKQFKSSVLEPTQQVSKTINTNMSLLGTTYTKFNKIGSSIVASSDTVFSNFIKGFQNLGEATKLKSAGLFKELQEGKYIENYKKHFGRSFELIGERWKSISKTVIDSVQSSFSWLKSGDMKKDLTGVMSGLNFKETFNNMRRSFESSIASLSATIASLSTTITGIVSSVGGAISTVLRTLGAIFIEIVIPMLLIGAMVWATIEGLRKIWQILTNLYNDNFLGIKAFVEFIASILSDIGDLMYASFLGFRRGFMDSFMPIIDQMRDIFDPIIIAIQRLKDAFSELLVIFGFSRDPLKRQYQFWKLIGQVIGFVTKLIAGPLVRSLRNTVLILTHFINSITSTVSFIKGFFSVFESAFENIRMAFSPLLKALDDLFNTVHSFVSVLTGSLFGRDFGTKANSMFSSMEKAGAAFGSFIKYFIEPYLKTLVKQIEIITWSLKLLRSLMEFVRDVVSNMPWAASGESVATYTPAHVPVVAQSAAVSGGAQQPQKQTFASDEKIEQTNKILTKILENVSQSNSTQKGNKNYRTIDELLGSYIDNAGNVI